MATPPDLLPVAPAGPRSGAASPFSVSLEVFTGPFEALLALVAEHRLDLAEVALARITDAFLAHLAAAGSGWDLSEASEFVLDAATLLDLKAARLLPVEEPDEAQDRAGLEVRDLAFARLLQYRAFRQVAAALADRLDAAARFTPRPGGPDPGARAVLPELALPPPEALARAAARAVVPRPVPTVPVAHLLAPAVSVEEQAGVLAGRLRREGVASFRSLTADAGAGLVVVARFLALLELYQRSAVAFEQTEPLGELTVRWTG